MKQTEKQITELDTLKDSFIKLAEDIGFLATATAPVHNLAVELQTGKLGIVNALLTMNVGADVSETLNLLADKITQIKGYEVVTTPVDTANATANQIFRMMFSDLKYDQKYEHVKANYCGEDKPYAGLLMTVLWKNTSGGMDLTGADAYYILEEDVFYTTDTNGNLVQFSNGQNVSLNTVAHGFKSDVLTPIRTVFYLYTHDSTASGERENTIGSMIDYCYNTNIPNIRYKTNSGAFKYYHVSNPDTCNIKWSGTGNESRTRFFYTNIEVMDGLWLMNNAASNMVYYSTPNLTTVLSGLILGNALWQQTLSFDSLESVQSDTTTNIYWINDVRIEHLSFPNLKLLSQAQFIANATCLLTLDMPELESAELTGIDKRSIQNVPLVKKLNLPKLSRIVGLRSSNCLFNCAGLEEIILADTVTVQSAVNSDSANGLHIKVKTINSENPQVSNPNTNGPGDWYGKSLYFDTIERGDLALGGTSSYGNKCTYLYLGCYGGPNDLIKAVFYENPSSPVPEVVEIREGARQPLYFHGFRNLTAEGIVSGIFEKLADNTYQEDGVTPAEPITITLGTTNLNKLSDLQKIIATSKNYILA